MGCGNTKQKATAPMRVVAGNVGTVPKNPKAEARKNAEEEIEPQNNKPLVQNNPYSIEPTQAKAQKITIKSAQPTSLTKKRANPDEEQKKKKDEEPPQKNSLQIEKENQAMLSNHQYVFKEQEELVDEADEEVLKMGMKNNITTANVTVADASKKDDFTTFNAVLPNLRIDGAPEKSSFDFDSLKVNAKKLNTEQSVLTKSQESQSKNLKNLLNNIEEDEFDDNIISNHNEKKQPAAENKKANDDDEFDV